MTAAQVLLLAAVIIPVIAFSSHRPALRKLAAVWSGFLLLSLAVNQLVGLDPNLYNGPVTTDSSGFSKNKNESGIISGVVHNPPVHAQNGYAAYAEYDEAGNIIELMLGHHLLEVKLSDGTLVRFEPGLAPEPEWGWHEDGNFRYLLPNERVCIAGTYRILRDSESKGPVLVPHYETDYIFLGDEKALRSSEFYRERTKRFRNAFPWWELQLGSMLVLLLVVAVRYFDARLERAERDQIQQSGE